MAAIWVTDFYNLQRIDARKAFYVAGSDVLGPMGHEFVPLASKEDAADFLKDHKGKKVLGFDQVTKAMPEQVDDDVPVALRLDVLRALDTLPRMQRAVLSLRYLEDRPIAEVASILGIGEGTVKKYAHRGCVTLQGSVHLTDEEASR